MQMVNLTIDGKQIQAPAGSSVLEAARSAGIYIPTLCYHPDLRPEGARFSKMASLKNITLAHMEVQKKANIISL